MGLLSRLFGGGGGDDRSPPTERQADKPNGARPTPPATRAPVERDYAMTWPSAGVPLEEALALRPDGNGVRWYPAARNATPPVPRAAEPVERISSPGLTLDATRMRAALVVSDTSLTKDELSLPSGRQALPTLHGLGSALGDVLDDGLG
ncbi:MAG: hypothetical protein RL033_2219, partial [Pseudomonadota bacterium]